MPGEVRRCVGVPGGKQTALSIFLDFFSVLSSRSHISTLCSLFMLESNCCTGTRVVTGSTNTQVTCVFMVFLLVV